MRQITFSDVAHFYLGCEVKSPTGRDAKFTGMNVEGSPLCRICYKNEEPNLVPLADITSVLRPVSSMTHDELSEFQKGVNYDLNSGFLEEEGDDMVNFEAAASATLWLCRNRFDVFNLIPSGQSISTEEI